MIQRYFFLPKKLSGAAGIAIIHWKLKRKTHVSTVAGMLESNTHVKTF